MDLGEFLGVAFIGVLAYSFSAKDIGKFQMMSGHNPMDKTDTVYVVDTTNGQTWYVDQVSNFLLPTLGPSLAWKQVYRAPFQRGPGEDFGSYQYLWTGTRFENLTRWEKFKKFITSQVRTDFK